MDTEPLTILFLALFSLVGIIVLGLNIRFKSWFFMSLIVATILELVGLGFKIAMKYHPTSIPIIILYIIPVLVAPTVFAIADYSLVSKM
jgi:hypothetical protein